MIYVLLASVLMAGSSFADDIKMPRVITVSGQAERKVVPDEAHVVVNLNSMNLKLATAKADHDAKLKKLLSMAKAQGVAEKKIRAQSSVVEPVYEYKQFTLPPDKVCEENYKKQLAVLEKKPAASVVIAPCPPNVESRQVLVGYRVQTSIDITVTDISKVGELMENITNAGFEKGSKNEWGQLLSMYYGLSNADKIRDEILVEAITNARSKAERMVKAAGADIKRVYSINESGIAMPVPMPMPMMARGMMAEGMAMADKAVAPPAGEQIINANVTVTFELKD